MSETIIRVEDAIIRDAEELATRAFAQHVATQRMNDGMFRSWRCQPPKSWTYGFDVTTTPGHLFVTGDIGELIVSRCDDMIAWARGAIHDLNYFAEKVPHAIPTRVWSYDKAVEWLKGELQDAVDENDDSEYAQSRVATLRDLMSHIATGGMNGEMDEHEFASAIYDTNRIDGCDWPNLSVFNSNFLWCREAVKWLLGSIR